MTYAQFANGTPAVAMPEYYQLQGGGVDAGFAGGGARGFATREREL